LNLTFVFSQIELQQQSSPLLPFCCSQIALSVSEKNKHQQADYYDNKYGNHRFVEIIVAQKEADKKACKNSRPAYCMLIMPRVASLA